MPYTAVAMAKSKLNLTPEERLERSQWDFFWISDDAVVTERSELAYVACARDVLCLNSVNRTRAEPDDLPRLLNEVQHAHRSVRSQWLVPGTFDTRPLKAALEVAGYAPAADHIAAVIEPQDYCPRLNPNISARMVETRDDLKACIGVSNRAFRRDVERITDVELRFQLQRCTHPDARIRRFVAYDDVSGEPLSSGGINVYPQIRFGFLWAGGTVPEGRGCGAYTAVLKARIDWAQRHGIDLVGLYARVGTSAPIVAKQGFVDVGRMTYWQRDKHNNLS